MQLEQTNCNLCGGSKSRLLRETTVRHYGRRVGFHLVQCRDCGLVFLSPRPRPEDIAEYYPPAYQADIRALLKAGGESWIFRVGLRALRRRRLPATIPGGKLLDIGCSSGRYLAAARAQGWQVQGIELDELAATSARQQLGLTVDQGDADEILTSYLDSSFDVVTMWHVLEHLFDPAAVLKQVARVLKPGGRLLLEVPNFRSPLRAVLGDAWFPLEPPRHLYHYTPNTLRRLIKQQDLALHKLRGIPSPEAVVWSMQSLFNGPTDTRDGGPVSANFVAMALLFPPSWIMAKLNLSDAMSAVAAKPAFSG